MKRVVAFVSLVAALGTVGVACKKGPEPTAPTGSGSADQAKDPWSAAASESSGSGSGAVASAPKPALLTRPLLWSAEKDGKTTYLFGTMHMGVDAATRLPPVVWDKLAASPSFAMEADLEDPKIAEMIKPTPTSLRDQLGDAYWKKLETALGATIASAVEHMPPMIPITALAVRGLPPTAAMDKVLQERAKKAGKPIVFLEAATRQLEILATWMDIKALKMMLDELDGTEQRTKATLDAYIEGDERKMLALADSEKAEALSHGYTAAEFDREMDDVLYNRNASWVEPIDRVHASGGAFIAVGALHLIGPRSVTDLLTKHGYKVTRIAP